MKKTHQILISLLLISAVLSASGAPAQASIATGVINYVAFGDSVASGVEGGISEAGSSNGYTDDIAAYLRSSNALGGFNEDFCTAGMTAKKLAADTSILGDKASSQYALVENADIATLTVGANDLLSPLYSYVDSLKSISDVDSAKFKAVMNALINEINDSTACTAIQANIETILQNILNVNPNVKIYVMGYYNPLPLASAMAGIDLIPAVIKFNTYIQAAVTDIAAKNISSSISYVDTMTAMAEDTASNLVLQDIHPTQAGYTVIAAEFLKQLKLLLSSNASAAAVSPTASTVVVNGKALPFGAYKINGSNYIKLRDVAVMLSGTDKQFNVYWDSQKNAIYLTSKTAYTSVGDEMKSSTNNAMVSAFSAVPVMYLDKREIGLSAYKIGNNNYFKLRELASLFNFSVVWNSGTNTISIDLKAGYTAPPSN